MVGLEPILTDGPTHSPLQSAELCLQLQSNSVNSDWILRRVNSGPQASHLIPLILVQTISFFLNGL